MTLSAIAPGFPSSSFPVVGFATIVSADFGSWTNTGVFIGGVLPLLTFNTPPFKESACVLYDRGTQIVTNTTMASASQSGTYDAILCTSGEAHFTIDVVGYFLPAPLEFKDYFVADETAFAQCSQWLSFATELSGGYAQVTLSGSEDSPGLTCTDPTVVNGLAEAIKTNSNYIETCDGHEWSYCFRGGFGQQGLSGHGEVWIDPPSLCSSSNCPNPGRILRACIESSNWGGLNTATCGAFGGATSQRMSIRFE